MARNITSSAYYNLASAPITADPMTIACWFQVSNLAVDNYLMGLSTVANTCRRELRIQASTNQLGCNVWDGSDHQSNSAATITANTWMHAAGTFNGTTFRQSFLNGVASTSNTVAAVYTTPQEMGVGTSLNGGGTMGGKIADAVIWNVVLTAAEIAQLANGVSPLYIRPSAIVAYWPMFGVANPEINVAGGGVASMPVSAGAPSAANDPPVEFFTARSIQAPSNVAQPATDFVLTPSTLATTRGVATGNYTITPNAIPSSSTAIALSDGGNGGTFTPSSLTFTTATPQTFTYTPPGSGGASTVTLTATATGGFSANHTATTTVSWIVGVTQAGLFWSPGNWDDVAPATFGVAIESMQATAPGAYLKFNITGTANIVLNIDPTPYSGFAGGTTPVVRYSLNNAAFTDVQVSTVATTITLGSGLTPGTTYSVAVFLRATSESVGDRWGSAGVSPTNAIRINGLKVDSGSTISAVTGLLTKRAIVFGDSITAGTHVDPTQSFYDSDATQAYAAGMAVALNAESGQVGYSSQGWERVGAGNVPKFTSVYNLLSAGRSRSFSGLDYVFVVHGTNDGLNGVSASTIQADAQAMIGSLRTACGASTLIFIMTPPGGFYNTNFAAAVAAAADSKAYAINIATLVPTSPFAAFASANEYTFDGVHPSLFGTSRISPAYAVLAKGNLSATVSGTSRARAVNGN